MSDPRSAFLSRMILVALHGIGKRYPTGVVLSGIDWEIKSGEKIALVGRNGSGKSTLMGILSGRMTPDAGIRTLGRGVRILELDQIPDRTIEQSLFEYVRDARADILALRARLDELTRAVAAAPDDEDLHTKLGGAQTEFEHLGGYDLDRQVEVTLGGLGFPTSAWRRRVGLLSGGERTRAELARLLLRPADLLLLDEPTNHLDIPAVEWLETFLTESTAAVVLISHDRVFLERFAGSVVDLSHKELEFYDGDYVYYRRAKPERRARQQKAFDLQAAEIARIEEFIVKNIAGQKTKQAQSRRKALGKLERLEQPKGDGATMRLRFEAQRRSFREVLIVEDLSKSIGELTLLDNVSFACERGDKIGVIGPNGSGKSTLLRMLIGDDVDYDGTIRIGERVNIAYFDQHLATLDGTGTVIDEIWNAHPQFEAGPLRSYLARFLFTGDDVFKNVVDLSGGEKNRLALARLMLTNANCLVLDEPTNHLDVDAREVLEEALAQFEGTAIVVSHDRRFLDRFTTKILYVADGGVAMSLGNYSDWSHRQQQDAVLRAAAESPKEPSDAAQQWQEQKKARSEQRRIQRKREEIECQIAETERGLERIETELADESSARDWQRLAALTEERATLYERLTGLYSALEEFTISDTEGPAP